MVDCLDVLGYLALLDCSCFCYLENTFFEDHDKFILETSNYFEVGSKMNSKKAISFLFFERNQSQIVLLTHRSQNISILTMHNLNVGDTLPVVCESGSNFI